MGDQQASEQGGSRTCAHQHNTAAKDGFVTCMPDMQSFGTRHSMGHSTLLCSQHPPKSLPNLSLMVVPAGRL